MTKRFTHCCPELYNIHYLNSSFPVLVKETLADAGEPVPPAESGVLRHLLAGLLGGRPPLRSWGGSLPGRNRPCSGHSSSQESPQPMAGDKLGSTPKGAPFPARPPGGRWVLWGPRHGDRFPLAPSLV